MKSNIKNLTIFVIISISLIAFYTVAEFVISTITGVHHDVLTGCVYAFFGTEIASCGLIKIFKLKGGESDERNVI